MENGRVLNRPLFLFLLDLEVKRARRYQNFFCVVKLKLSPRPGHEHRKELQTCYQVLSKCIAEELRETDILGSLGNDQLAALLPYADLFAGDHVRSRFEENLKYFDFPKEGYEVMIDRICFPYDGAAAEDLIRKVTGAEASC
jgi:hypothetical protein